MWPFTCSSAATRKPSVPCDHGTARNSCAKAQSQGFQGDSFFVGTAKSRSGSAKRVGTKRKYRRSKRIANGFCVLFGPLPPCWRRSRPSRHSPSRARSSGSSPARTARGSAVTPAGVTVFDRQRPAVNVRAAGHLEHSVVLGRGLDAAAADQAAHRQIIQLLHPAKNPHHLSD